MCVLKLDKGRAVGLSCLHALGKEKEEGLPSFYSFCPHDLPLIDTVFMTLAVETRG